MKLNNYSHIPFLILQVMLAMSCGGGTGVELLEDEDKKEANAEVHFEKSLPLFGSGNMVTYTEEESLEKDLEDVATIYFEGEFLKILSSLVRSNSPPALESGAISIATSAGMVAGSAMVNDFSTNNQVDGIDESDIVKSSGNAVYLAHGRKLLVIDLSGAVLQKMDFPENITLFLGHGKLLVLWEAWNVDRSAKKTMLQLLRVGNDHRVEKLKEMALDGDFIGARMINDCIHVIQQISIGPLFSQMVEFEDFKKQGKSDGWSVDEYIQRFSDLLPKLKKSFALAVKHKYFQGDHSQFDPSLLRGTARINRMISASGNILANSIMDEPVIDKLLRVYSLNISDAQNKISTASVFTTSLTLNSDSIYADHDHLVLAFKGARYANARNHEKCTAFMIFRLLDATCLPFAKAMLEGDILNQFSMDIHDGYLRIATTKGNSSTVYSLKVNPGHLELAGSVSGLGKNERIFSVRFVKNKAYVVTFRFIDPFYVIDLADPSSPRLAGELKIPGASNYLHPLDEHLILGVGFGDRRSDLKLSLFDVSDPANPTEVSQKIEPGFSSAATIDHHAFRYIRSLRKIVIPVRNGNGSNLKFFIYTLTHQSTISADSQIMHDVPFGTDGHKFPLRSLCIDDKLLTTGGYGMESHDLATWQRLWSLDLTGMQHLRTSLVLTDASGRERTSFNARELIKFKLMITNHSSKAQTLMFASAQQFEMKLKSGNEVAWQWSVDKVFSQTAIQVVIDAKATLTHELEWDQRNATGNLVDRLKYQVIGEILGYGNPLGLDMSLWP